MGFIVAKDGAPVSPRGSPPRLDVLRGRAIAAAERVAGVSVTRTVDRCYFVRDNMLKAVMTSGEERTRAWEKFGGHLIRKSPCWTARGSKGGTVRYMYLTLRYLYPTILTRRAAQYFTIRHLGPA